MLFVGGGCVLKVLLSLVSNEIAEGGVELWAYLLDDPEHVCVSYAWLFL